MGAAATPASSKTARASSSVRWPIQSAMIASISAAFRSRCCASANFGSRVSSGRPTARSARIAIVGALPDIASQRPSLVW